MTIFQEEKVMYQALWFNEDNFDGPIVKGYDVKNVINKLLRITKEENGTVEVYKITYNNRGYTVEIYNKFLVIQDIDLLYES